jgi:hypothetical protein
MLRLRPQQIHFVIMSLLIFLAVLLQTTVFARFESPWLNIDLLTILAVYMAVEHQLYAALFRLMLGAVILNSFSSAALGLHVMYYLQILVVANLVSRRLVLWNGLTQVGLFAGLFLLKYILVCGLFVAEDKNVDYVAFALQVLPGFVTTTLFVLPVFHLLAALDQRFEMQKVREEIVL